MKKTTLLILLPFVAGANLEFVVIPGLMWLGVRGTDLALIAAVFSAATVAYWYIFWRWFIQVVIQTKPIREDIQFGKDIEKELQTLGYIEKIREYFKNKYHWLLNSNGRYVKLIREGSYVYLFLMSLSPEPGGRFISVTLAAIVHSKKALLFTLAGDVLHSVVVVLGWSAVFGFFSKIFS